MLISDELIEYSPPRWWRVTDPNAGPEFTGHKVDLTITRVDDLDGVHFRLTWRIVDA